MYPTSDTPQIERSPKLQFVLLGIGISGLSSQSRLKPFFANNGEKGGRWVLLCFSCGFRKRKPVCEIAVIFSPFFWPPLSRNKIKCGEEKTPLPFGDIAIVIGEGTSPKICELVAKR